MSDRTVLAWIVAASGLVIGFLFWLLYVHEAPAAAASAESVLPAWNAAFNTCATLCLLAGWRAIRGGYRKRHALCMLSALAFSALFLITYIVHHATYGDTRFPADSALRPAYLFVLASHVLVTFAALPMILGTLYLAARRRFTEHRRLARWTLPAWLYVSVTGVLIFAMLEGAR